MTLAACSSCGAAVIWATHEKTGKVSPLDAAPSAAGNCVLDGKRYSILPRELRATFSGELRTSHFATCPNARAHRR